MELGPNRLQPLHRPILRRDRRVVRQFFSQGLDWSDSKFRATKQILRSSLRRQQAGRCVFCRQSIRQERRNAYEDIEHFLDKSKPAYRRWTFSPVNLAIACRACNFVKSTKDLGDANVKKARGLTSASGSFEWLHPYFDDFHRNIDIGPGWVYAVKLRAPKQAQASQMIMDLQLHSVAEMMKRKYSASARKEKLLRFALKCMKAGRSALAEYILEALADAEANAWAED
ncbi:HNH endonuclease [Rhizobium leguminosarum]|uniref:HNH endonuclease n=1 Tax=Rhizobium leguminosarum TaxID=384 RepID=UPI001AE100C4|nr:hypothetical protein [Rhizobium leguminosarum]MBP2443773.1 uncharacterized protein (TIGR02646 family) [Rhizobium leguminosarum]